MSATDARPAIASYRDAVTELVQADKPFGDVVDAIDALADLTRTQKAALRRFAFSLHVRAISTRHMSAMAGRFTRSRAEERVVR
jgi:hypothetical protein